MGFWEDVEGQMGEQEEYGGAEYEQLPENAWCLGTTINDEKNGWAPKTEKVDIKKGPNAGNTFYRFRTGIRTIGADSKCNENKHRGQYAKFSASIAPNKDKEPDSPLSGKMKGFFNVLFAPGVGGDVGKMTTDQKKARTKERNAVMLKHLAEVATKHSIVPESYNGEKSRTLTAAGRQAILSGPPRRVIFKTKYNRWTPEGGEERVTVEVSAWKDATPENIAEHKIVLFAGMEAEQKESATAVEF
jgi:hypothetical protein